MSQNVSLLPCSLRVVWLDNRILGTQFLKSSEGTAPLFPYIHCSLTSIDADENCITDSCTCAVPSAFVFSWLHLRFLFTTTFVKFHYTVIGDTCTYMCMCVISLRT